MPGYGSSRLFNKCRNLLTGILDASGRHRLRRFDLGFDERESERTGIIQGVKPGSNAWKAGVRDGQRWKPTDIAVGDPEHKAGMLVDGQPNRVLPCLDREFLSTEVPGTRRRLWH